MTQQTSPASKTEETGISPSLNLTNAPVPVVTGWERRWVDIRVKFTFLRTAMQCYRSPLKALATIRKLLQFKQAMNGRKEIRRCIKVEGKYYFSMYIPGYPSALFNQYIRTELNYISPHKQPVNRLQVLQLAVTNRCPLKCEHCFEWDNLNREETFSTEQLVQLVKKFSREGCAQFHLTGGEPMVKLARLTEIISQPGLKHEYYILSSGLNITEENALRLKKAGATGVIISLDHFDPVLHNLFRGSAHAYTHAVNAICSARKAGLVTALSLCATRSFITKANLWSYAKLARQLGVCFVQVLEPKAVGHYQDQPVLLTAAETDLLERFYLDINFDRACRDYPVFLYHGYHQRRLGCMSGGKRILYIDSAGHIDACPFCQTKSYEAAAIISGRLQIKDIQIGGCPAYK
ncbi:MAG: radical SAM protein [Sphingobacteriales bacterium]|nr:radical SAM protein [Sphingobacteriales bacterium]